MNDWYDNGYESIVGQIADIVLEVKTDDEPVNEAARRIYGMLSDLGFIDYDVEKDIFYGWYGENEDGEAA